MAENYYFDPNNLPTIETDGSVTLDLGTAFVGVTISNRTAGNNAINATGAQDITVIPGVTIFGQNDGINFAATGSETKPNKIFNGGGFISSVAGAAIHFSAGGDGIVTNQGIITGATTGTIGIKMDGDGKLDVLNTGTIIASGTAIVSGSASDRVINAGLIRSTGAEGIAVDLGAGDDIYDGSGGTTIGKIVLGEGNDRAYGGAGSEHFVGGLGNDFIDGGAGSDTVDYSTPPDGTTSAVTVNLTLSGPQGVGGGYGSDTLVNIENVVGGGGTDALTGNSADNWLQGGAGNDTLEGGAGNDTLDGGDGIDTVRFTGSTGVTVDLMDTGIRNTGYGYDIIINVENVEGSSGADSVSGNSEANYINGNFGNDTLRGGAGNDILKGDFGDDVLSGEADNDTLEGGIGNDKLDGGDGADSLDGGDGNDTLQGGTGNDTLKGGAGNDTAVFGGLYSAYTITRDGNGDENTKFTITGADGTDTLEGVRVLKFLGDSTHSAETYVLTNSAAPTTVSISGTGIRENSANGAVVGILSAIDADGDALTFSLQENDLFKLDDDGKTIRVKNKDLLNFETLSNGHLTATYTLHVTVSDGLKNLDGTPPTGTATKDVVVTIINEYEDAAVVRSGTNAGEQVVGEYGNDRVYGLGGNDQVFGRKGNDLLDGGAGNDFVIGGDGTSGAGLTESGKDTLYGGAGNDTLYGGDGDDILYGGAGNDTLYGGTGRDSFVFNASTAGSNMDYIADFKPSDDTIRLSHAIFSKIARGTLSSNAFVVGNQVKDKDDRIIYYKSAGALFYDPDGTGKEKAVQFAIIGKNLSLTHNDFIIF